MQVWNVLHTARWKCRTQKKSQLQKNHHLGTITQLCRAISLQLRHVSIIRKKNLLNSNVSPTSPHNMVNFGPLMAEICWWVWSTSSKFQRVLRLGSVTARHSSSGRQSKFVALSTDATYIRKGSHHVGHCIHVCFRLLYAWDYVTEERWSVSNYTNYNDQNKFSGINILLISLFLKS